MGFHELAIPSGSPARQRIEAAALASPRAEVERITLANQALSADLVASQEERSKLIGERASLVKEVADLKRTVTALKAHFRDSNVDLAAPIIFIKTIQQVVADYFGVTVREMVSDRRSRMIAIPRQLAMFLSREMTPRTLTEIGIRFGGRDHTTVLHSCMKIANMVAAGLEVATEAAELRGLVLEAAALAKAEATEAAA